MAYPRFVYRSGPSQTTWGGRTYQYKTVETDRQRADAIADGWHDTREAAFAPQPIAPAEHEPVDDTAPPTRAEMLQRAEQLGIKVDGRWSDKRLLAEIAAVS